MTGSGSWARRHPFLLIALIPLGANLLGSLVNIWYNVSIVEPRLDGREREVFHQAIGFYNAAVYPITIALWIWLLAPIFRCHRRLRDGERPDEETLLRCRRRTLRAPVRGAQICLGGWLPSALVIPLALALRAPTADPRVYLDIPVSVLVSATIAVTQTYLLIEYLFIELLYPRFFHDTSPIEVPGARPLSLTRRLLVFTVAVGVCPVASLVLLAFAASPGGEPRYLALVAAVGAIGIFFGVAASWLAARLVLRPLLHLTEAARKGAAGDYGWRVRLQRADELGELIDSFNRMTVGLAEKQRIQETFGRFVSPDVARTLMDRDPTLGGRLQDLTVMFVDIRDFTARSSRCGPQQAVALMNQILPGMADAVERHGGIINKFLGDGLMAMFGAPTAHEDHAGAAVRSARDVVAGLEAVNEALLAAGDSQPIRIGIGIHTGPAVVGIVGAPRRMEYTAIGETVNLAQRIEALNKEFDTTVLLSEASWRALREPVEGVPMPAANVKGFSQPIQVYRAIR